MEIRQSSSTSPTLKPEAPDPKPRAPNRKHLAHRTRRRGDGFTLDQMRRYLGFEVRVSPKVLEAQAKEGAQFVVTTGPHGVDSMFRVLLEGRLLSSVIEQNPHREVSFGLGSGTSSHRSIPALALIPPTLCRDQTGVLDEAFPKIHHKIYTLAASVPSPPTLHTRFCCSLATPSYTLQTPSPKSHDFGAAWYVGNSGYGRSSKP
jgi:hypothetical protein